jgi:hypothetical protein
MVAIVAAGRNTIAACWRATGITRASIRVATKPMLRAILKATDLCFTQPAFVAQDRSVSAGPT